MKMPGRTLLTTIVLGFLFGLAYIPMVTTLGTFMGGAMAFRMTHLAFVTVYACLLARWGKAPMGPVLFPLAVLLACASWIPSTNDFLLLSLATLAWIRSGVSFKGPLLRSVGTELLLCFGGGALVSALAPHSRVGWALGIWLFFLVQSIYFVISGTRGGASEDAVSTDPFEHARRQAERILSTVSG